MSQLDNIAVQLRAHLNDHDIKLWEEPYYKPDVGSIDAALDELSQRLSHELHISVSNCKISLLELQNNALRKLAARRQFNETGMATFHVRCVDGEGGTVNTLEVNCTLNEVGANLQRKIAEQLKLRESTHVKCISAGRIVLPKATLQSQGLKNNQQLLVIVGHGNVEGEALYERIRQIQRDVETVIDSDRRFVELEDQDGNAMFLPPNENRSLLLGMGLCEKGRAAMRREHYDEALLIFLEADEKFSACDSKFLESVDNYALLNLDIVWCYLCLKNLNQLPDAQRRLDSCERIFRRSYGENNSRLYALKGYNCPERALIMRLQLLQGVVLFHQNRRSEARARLRVAEGTLSNLKIDPEQLELLIEMGFDPADARLALRTSNGNVEHAVQFIQQRRQRLEAARLSSNSERNLNRRLTQLQLGNDESNWVHPRSVCRLIELGYDRQLVIEALRRTDNDLVRSLDLLQSHSDELRQNLPATATANDQMLNTLVELGFKMPSARAALETTQNDLDSAIAFLLKSYANEEELLSAMNFISSLINPRTDDDASGSTQSSNRGLLLGLGSHRNLLKSVLSKAKAEIESYRAYKRFNEDLPDNEQDYLDLTLEHEEQILNEYKQLLHDVN